MDVRIFGGAANTPAVVDVDGHLHVKSICNSLISNASWDGDAYTLKVEVPLTGIIAQPILFLENSRGGKDKGRTSNMIVREITVSSDANCYVEVRLESALTSGGGTPGVYALNRSQAVTTNVTARDGVALVLDSTGEFEIRSLFIAANTPYTFDFHDALMLPTGKTVSVWATGVVADEIRCHADIYWGPEPE